MTFGKGRWRPGRASRTIRRKNIRSMGYGVQSCSGCVIACLEGDAAIWLLVIGIPVVFVVFHCMFSKLVGKHADRIRGYGEDKMHVLRFFDVKGYVIMVIMMGGGISLRAFGIVPGWFVAFFYTGLGTALALAGIGFLVHYIKRGDVITCPVTKKTRLA